MRKLVHMMQIRGNDMRDLGCDLTCPVYGLSPGLQMNGRQWLLSTIVLFKRTSNRSYDNEAVFGVSTKKPTNHSHRVVYRLLVLKYSSMRVLVCVLLSACSLLYVIDCDSCSWPISTTSAATEAGELELTCGTCFGRCAPVGFVVCLKASGLRFFSFVFPFESTRPTACISQPCPIRPFTILVY